MDKSKIMYTYEEALKYATEYFNGEEMLGRIFVDKYALRDEQNNILEKTPDDMHKRIAKEFARIEKKKFKIPLSYKEIYDKLYRYNTIIPQGSPMYGIGNKYQYISLSNCFVLETPEDSYGGILETDQQLVQISKRRGGVGICLDKLRPNKTHTSNAARTSTGIISWMNRYSNSIREVGQSGRRGALMLTLNVHHPDIEAFITAKANKTAVTGANVSVQYTDEFLTAVENDTEYEQRWPINSETPEISRMVRAREIWNLAVHHAWDNAEPGLQFIDTVRRESPADCYEFFVTHTSNPCSEIYLSPYDSCRLLVVNLMKFVKNPYSQDASFDFDEFYENAKLAQRLMDDIVDLEEEAIYRILKKIESDPEEEYLKASEKRLWKNVLRACKEGRRTGTGITALGDAVAALGMKYSSDESIVFVEQVYKTLKLGAYRASVDMAKELGPFPVWEFEKEKNNPFLVRIKDEDPQLWSDMKKYGRRNIALLTTAPTGTVSTQTGFCINNIWYHNTSSGIEPCFMVEYTRRKKGNPGDNDFRTDFIDDIGDHWMEFPVYHSGLQAWMDVNNKSDSSDSPYSGACAPDINWVKRVQIQAVAQRHIDHSISSTVNLPNDVTEEEVDKIYRAAWHSGCKGITVYRDGCRSGVLISNEKSVDNNDERNGKINKNHAPGRPKEVVADVHHVRAKGIDHIVFVGLVDDEPYEVLAMELGNVKRFDTTEPLSKGDIARKNKKAVVTKLKRGHYKAELEDGTIIENILEHCEPETDVITRLSSTALRHGTDIKFLVHQLEKTPGDLTSFAKACARALKTYIPENTKITGEKCPECGGENLVRSEGCKSCISCGQYSKCG